MNERLKAAIKIWRAVNSDNVLISQLRSKSIRYAATQHPAKEEYDAAAELLAAALKWGGDTD